MKRWLALVPWVMHVGACQSPEPVRWQPAVLTELNKPLEAEIYEALRDMLGGATVVLDLAELTRVPHLFIERAPVRDAKGISFHVAERETPQVFRLELRAGQCQIVQQKTGLVRLLQHAKCQAAPT